MTCETLSELLQGLLAVMINNAIKTGNLWTCDWDSVPVPARTAAPVGQREKLVSSRAARQGLNLTDRRRLSVRSTEAPTSCAATDHTHLSATAASKPPKHPSELRSAAHSSGAATGANKQTGPGWNRQAAIGVKKQTAIGAKQQPAIAATKQPAIGVSKQTVPDVSKQRFSEQSASVRTSNSSSSTAGNPTRHITARAQGLSPMAATAPAARKAVPLTAARHNQTPSRALPQPSKQNAHMPLSADIPRRQKPLPDSAIGVTGTPVRPKQHQVLPQAPVARKPMTSTSDSGAAHTQILGQMQPQAQAVPPAPRKPVHSMSSRPEPLPMPPGAPRKPNQGLLSRLELMPLDSPESTPSAAAAPQDPESIAFMVPSMAALASIGDAADPHATPLADSTGVQAPSLKPVLAAQSVRAARNALPGAAKTPAAAKRSAATLQKEAGAVKSTISRGTIPASALPAAVPVRGPCQRPCLLEWQCPSQQQSQQPRRM